MTKKIALLIIAVLFVNFLEAGEGQSNIDKMLALHCQLGQLEDVKKLIESDADLQDRSSCWNHTLNIACEKGHLDIVKYLVGDKKANPQGPSLMTNAFQQACRNGHIATVKYLVEHCNINIEKTTGILKLSPLRFACKHKRIEVIHYLTDHGANFEAQDKFNKTPYDFLNAEDKHALRIYKNESHDPHKLLLVDLGYKLDENSNLRVFPDDIINEIRNQSIQLGLSSAQAKIWKPVHEKAHELNGDSCARNEISNLARIVYFWPEKTKEKISEKLLELGM
jgi:ankyrin repeat protein